MSELESVIEQIDSDDEDIDDDGEDVNGIENDRPEDGEVDIVGLRVVEKTRNGYISTIKFITKFFISFIPTGIALLLLN